MLKSRILTALVLIPIVVSAVYFLHSTWFAALILVFILLGAWEWGAMSGYVDWRKRSLYTINFALFGSICFYLRQTEIIANLVLVGVVWWIVAIYLIFTYKTSSSTISYGKTLRSIMGLLILLPAWLSFYQLHQFKPGGNLWVIFLLVLIWIADSAAYVTGKCWGKNKLCPQVSPGKTWEGVFGALLASLLFAALYSIVFNMQAIEIMIFLVVCTLTVIVSIFGDLIVSLIKREADMKDSGTLLPGHGGIMDRIDSLTAAGPVFLVGIWLLEAMV